MTLTANKATSVVVTGNDGLNLTATGSTKVTNFDASAVVGLDSLDTATNMAVTYTSVNTSSSAAVTIKGGAGNDTLQGNAGNDTITGGAGTDGITYTGGNDTLSGGAGVDTFSFTGALLAANDAASNTTTVDGGAGTDIVSISTTGATIVDADFDGFTSVETLTTTNGTNSITVGAKADASGIATFNFGTGADLLTMTDVDFDNASTINGSVLGDRYILDETTVSVDTIVYSLLAGGIATDGDGFDGADDDGVVNNTTDDLTESTAATAGAGDYIAGFDQGVDKIKFDGTLEGALEGSAAAVRITSAGAFDLDTVGVIVVDNSVATTADFGDLSAVITAIDASLAGGTNINANDEMVIVLNRTSNLDEHGMFYFKDVGGNGDVDANDLLSFIGTIELDADGDMAATDFIV
jgi:hypothetical protein